MVSFRTGSILLATAMCASLASLSTPAHAFYIPGFSPNIFKVGERVPLHVNKIFSKKSPLPYAYADLPFVCPSTHAKNEWLNLGEVLRGDRISTSDYEVWRRDGNVLAIVKLYLHANAGMFTGKKKVTTHVPLFLFLSTSLLCFFSLWWARTSSARCCVHKRSRRRNQHSPKSSSPTTTTWNGTKGWQAPTLSQIRSSTKRKIL